MEREEPGGPKILKDSSNNPTNKTATLMNWSNLSRKPPSPTTTKGAHSTAGRGPPITPSTTHHASCRTRIKRRSWAKEIESPGRMEVKSGMFWRWTSMLMVLSSSPRPIHTREEASGSSSRTPFESFCFLTEGCRRRSSRSPPRSSLRGSVSFALSPACVHSLGTEAEEGPDIQKNQQPLSNRQEEGIFRVYVVVSSPSALLRREEP